MRSVPWSVTADAVRSFARTAGVWFPSLCAIHCLATPLLPLLPALFQLSALTERLLFAVSFAMTAASLWSAWRVHRSWTPWMLWLPGSSVWVLALVGVLPEWAGGAVGGTSMALATIRSGVLLRRAGHRDCDCPACEAAVENEPLVTTPATS